MGQWDWAIDKLRGASMQQLLYACDQLNPGQRQTLLRLCVNKPINDRPRFGLRVVSDLFMPPGRFAGLSDADRDYNEARMFILRKLDERSNLANKPERLSRTFYPEYSTQNRRQRMVDLVRDHADLV